MLKALIIQRLPYELVYTQPNLPVTSNYSEIILYAWNCDQAFALCCLLRICVFPSIRPEPAWQPSAGHTQVPLWPGNPPRQVWRPGQHRKGSGERAAGCRQVVVRRRECLPASDDGYSPSGRNTGVAIIVFSGGGYEDLASISRARRPVIGFKGDHVCSVEVPRSALGARTRTKNANAR